MAYNFDKKTVYNIVNVVEMIKNVEKAKTIGDIQGKISTLQRLYLKYSKGFMESNEEDIVSARRHLGTMDTVRYFDVFKKSDLIRILPDTVMKDIRRSPVIKLETTNYQELLDIVQQIIKDHHGQVVP